MSLQFCKVRVKILSALRKINDWAPKGPEEGEKKFLPICFFHEI